MRVISEVAFIEKRKVKQMLYKYDSEEEMESHILMMRTNGYEKDWSDRGVLKVKYRRQEEI